MGPRDTLSRYREWVSLLLEALKQPLQIFLDGLDRLAAKAEAFRLLQILIEERSPFLRFILLSRSYPPLSLEFQNLKMSRQALILENEDLAFTSQEIKQFFKDIHGLSLDSDQTDRIYKATEGWIGGIILLTQCLEPLRGVFGCGITWITACPIVFKGRPSSFSARRPLLPFHRTSRIFW